jgi:hypothetical protein
MPALPANEPNRRGVSITKPLPALVIALADDQTVGSSEQRAAAVGIRIPCRS